MRITVIHNTLDTFKLIERAQHRLRRRARRAFREPDRGPLPSLPPILALLAERLRGPPAQGDRHAADARW